jgi:AraC-like DNA-binding protein
MRESTVSAALVIDLIRYLERLGTPPSGVLAALRTDASVLESPNARLPGSLMERLWEHAVRLTGDADLGLHCAEKFNPGALNILGYILLSCRSAGEALGRLAQYAALLNDGLRVRVTRESDRTVCRYEVVPHLDNYLARAPRHGMETMACGTLITLRRLTSRHIKPLAVTFQHCKPPDITENNRIFGTVRFGQPDNLLEFRSADLAVGLLSANPALLEVFEAQARELLGQMDQRGPVSRRVLGILARRITVTTPSLEEVAGELAMSGRSVQRELRAENTSYRQLVEQVRKEIAVRHLARPGASASEAAFLLGFSEPSAFTRAFRRWTGAPPTQYQSV